MPTDQKRNLIIVIILILVLGGIFYAKRSRENSPLEEYSARQDLAEGGGESTPSSELATPQEGNKPKPALTYDEYLQQGINYETKGQLLNAINSYKKASEIYPKEYVPYSNAGSAYYSLGNFIEAEKHFLQALKLSPDSVSVYTKLYEVYFYGMKRDEEQMKAFFVDALKNTNNSINIVKLYASYLEQINEFESALAIWQSLLKFEPDNTAYKSKIEALREKVLP